LIWCEDHGSLAFFEGDRAEVAETPNFEEGDLVSFKIRDGRGMRLAFEVEVVSSDQYPCLAADLRGMTEAENIASLPSQTDVDCKILPFTLSPERRGKAPQRKPGNQQAVRKFS
jgi:hypothetical protein